MFDLITYKRRLINIVDGETVWSVHSERLPISPPGEHKCRRHAGIFHDWGYPAFRLFSGINKTSTRLFSLIGWWGTNCRGLVFSKYGYNISGGWYQHYLARIRWTKRLAYVSDEIFIRWFATKSGKLFYNQMKSYTQKRIVWVFKAIEVFLEFNLDRDFNCVNFFSSVRKMKIFWTTSRYLIPCVLSSANANI